MGHSLTDHSIGISRDAPDGANGMPCADGDEALAARVVGLVNRLGRTLHCLQFAEGLNPAQWEALRYFGRANRYSRTPSALADYLGTTKGTVSQTIKALEAKGLITRGRHDRDRRAVVLEVTEAGRSVLGRDPIKRIEHAAGDLVDQLPAARDFLNQLVSGLNDEAGAAGFGVCEECTHFCKNAAGLGTGGPHRCGLTGDPLSDGDSVKICVSHARCSG